MAKSKRYKGVYSDRRMSYGRVRKGIRWRAQHMHKGAKWNSVHFDTEREAAIAYDKRMIYLGMEPVNILRKNE